MFSLFKTAKWNDDPNQRLLAQMILRAALYEYTHGKNGEPLSATKIFQHCSACGWPTKESGNRIVHAASMIKVVAPPDVYRIAKRIAHDLYVNGQPPPVDEGGRVEIRQSDWTAIGSSAIKRWGIIGMLDTGGELQVQIDISFSRSNISGHLEPHIFIFLHPNTFGNHEGFVTLQIANQEEKLDAPFMTARIELVDDGSVIVTPMDRSGVDYVVNNVLSSGRRFRILMIIPPKEVIFRAILPNDSNALSDVTSRLPRG